MRIVLGKVQRVQTELIPLDRYRGSSMNYHGFFCAKILGKSPCIRALFLIHRKNLVALMRESSVFL